MQETRNNCFGNVRCYYISAFVLICFCQTKGRATFFLPEKKCCEFLASYGDFFFQSDIPSWYI